MSDVLTAVLLVVVIVAVGLVTWHAVPYVEGEPHTYRINEGARWPDTEPDDTVFVVMWPEDAPDQRCFAAGGVIVPDPLSIVCEIRV